MKEEEERNGQKKKRRKRRKIKKGKKKKRSENCSTYLVFIARIRLKSLPSSKLFCKCFRTLRICSNIRRFCELVFDSITVYERSRKWPYFILHIALINAEICAIIQHQLYKDCIILSIISISYSNIRFYSTSISPW